MNCNDCKNEMYQLGDATTDPLLAAALEQHIAICPSCAAEYNSMQAVLNTLQPNTVINAPLSLKQNIISQLSKNDIVMETTIKKRNPLSPVIKRVLAAAAVIAAVILVIPFFNKKGSAGNAATNYFQNAIDATAMVKNMVIHFSMRTDEKDNFELIGKDLPMVNHTVTEIFARPEKWRVEKPGRIVVCDGSNQYLWVPAVQQASKGPASAGFVEWCKILLDPSSILMKEKEETKAAGSTITYKEEGDKQYVTIVSKAKGNFLNDYLKNSSVNTSDNRREYVFDRHSKLLKGLKIWLLEGKTETLIFTIDNVDYDTTIGESVFSISLPAAVQWQTINTDIASENFSNISSKRAAELIFDALAKKDVESTKAAWSQVSNFTMSSIENKYGGLQVLKIGESFKSGEYPGEFVPYEINLPDGTFKKAKLALRNDNKNKVWVVDGGI